MLMLSSINTSSVMLTASSEEELSSLKKDALSRCYNAIDKVGIKCYLEKTLGGRTIEISIPNLRNFEPIVDLLYDLDYEVLETCFVGYSKAALRFNLSIYYESVDTLTAFKLSNCIVIYFAAWNNNNEQ